jgi:hypothetical protein
MNFVGALIITIGSLFFWVNACNPIALLLWGTETKAEVYAASAISARRSSAFAKYKFTTEDNTVAHGTFIGTRNAPGHSVRILYLPSNPAVNGPASLGYGAAQLGFYGIIGWLLSLWAVRVAMPKRAMSSNAGQEEAADAPLMSNPDAPVLGADEVRGKRRSAFGLCLLLSGCIIIAALIYLRKMVPGYSVPLFF